jgi:hypothetical protein
MHRILTDERRAHAQELVEDRAEGKDVRPMVDPPAHLLRRDVAEASHDQPGSCEAALGVRHLSDAEVEDFYLTAAQEEDVAGLDVPVDDPHLVRVVESVAHLDHDGERVLEGQRFPLSNEVLQVFAFEKLHDNEELPILIAHCIDGDDVGMTQPGARLRLTEEPGAELVGDLDFRRDHLESDEPIENGVMGFEDRPHAPASEPLDDPVLPDLLRHQASSTSASAAPNRCALSVVSTRAALILSRPPCAFV